MLKWTFTGSADEIICESGWTCSETEKWSYSISIKCSKTGKISFIADRMSTNDGMAHDKIGDIQQECPTVKDAKRIIDQWHSNLYSDNDSEFNEYGGNTGTMWDYETAQWSGKFKCVNCGDSITDSYQIQGILHHGSKHECPKCFYERNNK